MNKPYFCQKLFLTDWRHKRLQNTIDLLLFYGEHFYRFSESDLRIRQKKTFISQQTYLYIQATDILKFYEVLFRTYFKGLFFSLKNSYYAYIPLYMHKKLPKLWNEKEQKQIKFYEKSLGESIILQATKNLNILFHSPGWVHAQKVRLHHCTRP